MKQLYTKINKTELPFLEDIYVWEAPDRLWEEKGKSWYVSYSFFFILVIAIGALLGEYIFIVAVIAFAFLWFVQGATPPQIYEHRINSIGIKAFDRLYKWENIKYFWMSKKKEEYFLNLDIIEDLSKTTMRRLTLILPLPEQDKELFFLLIKNVDYGNKENVSFNIISSFLQGSHLPISRYIPDSINKK